MLRQWVLLVAAVFFSTSSAQNLSANYNGPLRPQVHFSPPDGFMNDPNGMFQDPDGLWHLYYQYNPTAIVAGNQHWGHATSPDLYHWTNQPIALYPPASGANVFSGSAVLDPNNTSGFFPNQTNGVVAIYTLNGVVQDQNIAYSVDGGYTFTPYLSNPVLDINSTQFRDPKVIWHAPTQKWVMTISYASDYAIGIFTSPDLKSWDHQSNFSHAGLLGIQYECPNMIEIPVFNQTSGNPSPSSKSEETLWLMQISINPGAPLGGSISQYFTGQFNGTHFTALDAAARLTDFSKDNYAGQFFYGIPANQPQVSIIWASNWQYSQLVPTATEGWRSAMSLPRQNFLSYSEEFLSYELIAAPYDISPVLDTVIAKHENLGNGSLSAAFGKDVLPSNAIYMNLTITNASSLSTSGAINITLCSSTTGESIIVGQIPLSNVGGDFFMIRQNTHGFENPFFTSQFSTAIVINDSFNVEMVFDRSLVEVFLGGGRRSGTMSVFPKGEMDKVEICSGGMGEGVGVKVEVWGLKGTWGAVVEEKIETVSQKLADNIEEKEKETARDVEPGYGGGGGKDRDCPTENCG